MIEQIEISSLDLRYESYRMKSPGAEKAMLGSISENGIRDHLQGVDTNEARILLNGFKRYRCAKRLGIGIVPYCSLDDFKNGPFSLSEDTKNKSFKITSFK